MHRISYIGFRILIGLFKILPFPLLYLLSDILRFLLKNVVRYRRKVIQKNLDYCFPEMAAIKKSEIADAFYKNFIDIILESLKGLAIKPKKLVNRFKLKNPEVLKEAYSNGKHLMVYSQHYNNWEWAAVSLGLQTDHHIVGVTKLIANPYINNYMAKRRTGPNVSSVTARLTLRYLRKLKEKSQPEALVFIADQRPSGQEKFIELPFLGGVANFHHGAALFTHSYNLPIYSIDIHRTGRGHYDVEFVRLVAENETLTAEQITTQYKEHLEKLILKSPESWLWSHKRFKKYVDYKK